jgi:hypothetical protein
MKQLTKSIEFLILLLAVSTIGLAQEQTEWEKATQEYLQQAKSTRQQVETERKEYTEMENSKTLHFENESTRAEVKIKLTDDFNFMLIQIHGSFEKGETLIELFDPKGDKKGFFTIKTETTITKGKNTTLMEIVHGKLEKHFREPLKGDWLIRISPKNAFGFINVSSTLIYNPQIQVLELDQIKNDTE